MLLIHALDLFFSCRADAIRLAADVTRLALEMLFVLTVGHKAQVALCEEIQLPSGEQQRGMRYSRAIPFCGFKVDRLLQQDPAVYW